MFHKARIKLTFWYLLIIMLVSALFSLAIYKGFTLEFERFDRLQRSRIENTLPFRDFRMPRLNVDQELINQAKERARNSLILINLGILILAGGASYFLAGRTLKPIEQMLDDQNRFIADASHELRTPLTALKSEIEVSLRDKDLKLREAKKLLESNLEEVNRLSLLSERMTDLVRCQKINNQTFKQIKISQVWQEAIKQVKPLLLQKQINLHRDSQDYVLEGVFDRLVQLLVILLDNAVKYSQIKYQIFLTTSQLDHQIRIEVKDEGMGIDKRDLPYIFDRFFQADKSRSENASGFGLGLSIAKNIVNMHSGTIAVESKPGKGTKFIIWLPEKQTMPLSFFSALRNKLNRLGKKI